MNQTLDSIRDRGVCLTGTQVLVRRPTFEDAEALVELMRTDHVLHKAAGMSGNGPPSGAAYLADLGRWEQANNALCLVHVSLKLGRAIGMISLTRIDLSAGSGRIGYWTASSCWGQGLTREAFGLVLGLARSIGLTAIRANIPADNVASQRIYQRYGGVVETEHESKLTFRIDLSM